MPVSRYYGGHGEKVMRDMLKRYGAEKGEDVFYATANKRGLTPEDTQNAAIEALGGHSKRKKAKKRHR